MTSAPAKRFTFVSWNVRGLGEDDKCVAVKAVLSTAAVSVVCIQEAKLQNVPVFKALAFLPGHVARSLVFQASTGASGELITAWDDRVLELVSSSQLPGLLTARLRYRASGLCLTITNAYGPCAGPDRALFLNNITATAGGILEPWSILGDFNFIRLPHEKSKRELLCCGRREFQRLH